MGDEMSSFGTCARAKLDEVICTAESFLIVLDEDEGVSEVAKMEEEIEEAGVIGGVEADTGFIEDIEDAGEAPADLGGESCAAGFSSRKSVHGAIEGEISETELLKKAEALKDGLAKGFEGMGGWTGWGSELGKPVAGLGNGESAVGGDVVALAWGTSESDGEGGEGEAFSSAGGAKSGAKESAEAGAGGFGLEGEELALEFGDDALEWFFGKGRAPFGAVEEEFLGGGGP